MNLFALQASLALVVVVVVPSLADASLTVSQRTMILNRHNEIRRGVSPPAADMEAMTWDENLAKVAQRYAEKCVWEHNPSRSNEHRAINPQALYPVGENLYLTTHWEVNHALRAGMKSFEDEKPFYHFNSNYCSKEPCGHYTQVVWSTSNKVGCGIARCNRVRNSPYPEASYVMVCNYGPTGNWRGQHPYKTGPKCSHCPEGRQLCIQGLCYPGKARQESQPEAGASAPQAGSPGQAAAGQSALDRTNLNGQMIGVLMKTVGDLGKRLSALEAEKNQAVRPSAHLNGVSGPSAKVAPDTKNEALFWSPSTDGSRLQGGFILVDGKLVVPQTGLYFVYGQIWTSRDGPVRFWIAAGHRRLMVGGSMDGKMQTTSLGGLHRLNKGDQLQVVVINKSKTTEQSVWPAKGHSYFGAFMV